MKEEYLPLCMHLQDTEPVDKSTSEHHTIDISLSVQSVEGNIF
jgi:hypothetical protein